MKKLTISVLLALAFITAKAQVKPKVYTSNKKIKINKNKPKPQGIKITNFKKISINDLNKLDIPIAQISADKLNDKPTRTWSINPMKQYEGNLFLTLLYGTWSKENWKIGSGTVSETMGLNIINSREEFSNRGGYNNSGQWRYIFPQIIKFIAAGDTEYILKIKFHGYVIPNHSIYIGRDSYISEVNLNEYKEANYLFKQADSGEVYIYISPILHKLNGNVDGFLSTTIKEITISRFD